MKLNPEAADPAKLDVRSNNRKVTFSKIEVLEFPYTIGNTPCSSGVPIGCDCKAQFKMFVDIDLFENHRPERRSKLDFHLSAIDRTTILHQQGFSIKEISAATRDATTIRNQRMETLRELRDEMRSVMLQGRLKENQQSPCTATDTKASSVIPNQSFQSPVCTSPLRSSHHRQNVVTRPRRRRLSQTTSPMPLRIQTSPMTEGMRRLALSPVRTKGKRSRDAIDTSDTDTKMLKISIPSKPTSPLPTPKGNDSDGTAFFCPSPSLTPTKKANRIHFRTDWMDKENDHRDTPKNLTLPVKRNRATPNKRGIGECGDQPLRMYKRFCSPPPVSPVSIGRLF